MDLLPSLPVKVDSTLPQDLLPKKFLSKRKIILLISGLFLSSLIILGIFFSKNISTLLGRLGVYRLMRNVGLIRPTVPGYFEALKTQNLVYDYNNDGVVTGDDYSFLVAASAKKQAEASPTPTEAPAGTFQEATVEADEVNAASDRVTLPSIRAFGTDSFNGASTVDYPIGLPQGSGISVPGLSVNYSSSAIDDMFIGVETRWRNDTSHSYQKQANQVGLGWGLSGFASISRDTQGTLNDPNDDTFILSLPTGSANLSKESDDGAYSVWRTVPNLKVKVERYARCKNHYYGANNQYSINVCRYSWTATTPDGTKYYFGSPTTQTNWKRANDPDASYFAEGTGNDWFPLYETANSYGTRAWFIYGSDFKGWHALTYKWSLYSIESVYANSEAKAFYSDRFAFGDYQGKKYVSAVYPAKITYGLHEVAFEYEARSDKATHQGDRATPEQPIKSTDRLKKILVKSRNQVQNAYTFEYIYGYRTVDHPDPNNPVGGKAIHSLLRKITVWDSDPAVNASAKRLPFYTFSYGANCNGFSGGCPLTSFNADTGTTQVQTPNDFFLREADNGLNGKTVFEYFTDGGGGNALSVQYCDPDKLDFEERTCKTDHRYNIQTHRVAARVDYDGMGNSFRTALNYSTNTPLAYVDGYGEVEYWFDGRNCCKASSSGSCRVGVPSGCKCPGDSYTGVTNHQWDCSGGTNCDWDSRSRTDCSQDYPREYVYRCTNPANSNRYICPGTRNAPNMTCYSNCSLAYRSNPFKGYEFLGYPDVETVVYEKNSASDVAARSKSYYHQAIQTASCFKPSPLKGISYKNQVYDADNPTKYSEEIQSYRVRFGPMFATETELADTELNSYCPNYNQNTKVSLVLPTESVAKSFMPSPQLCTKSTTDYNNLDGTRDAYANPHKTTNWGKVSCTNPSQDDTTDTLRYSYSDYTSANATRWILPMPKESWIGSSNPVNGYNHTRVFYDNQTYGNLGDKGQVTKTQTLVGGIVNSETTIAYNATYPWQVFRTTDPYGRRTTTYYDGIYKIFPTQVTNDAGQTVSTTYDFNISATNHPNYGGNRGLLVAITDSNNAITYNAYDSWGRLIRTYLPGKSYTDAKPSSLTQYYYFNEDEQSPCDVSTNCLVGLGKLLNGTYTPKMLVGSATYYSEVGPAGVRPGNHSYYNGLGQLVQSRQVWIHEQWENLGIPVEGEGYRDLLTSATYNSLGQAEYSSSVYTAQPYNSYPQNPYDTRNFVTDPGVLKTRYTYDGLGRQNWVYFPDGTRNETVYEVDGDPLKIKILDANCKDSDSTTLCSEKISVSDAFGQAIENRVVDIYAARTYTTRNRYHPVLGFPTETIDTLGTTVSRIEYDNLGRKTKMWDIDMSPSMSGDTNSWRYEYDLLGNLVRQTNPKSAVSVLTYDNLYRLTRKTVNGTTLLENVYDTCTNGVGRLCTTSSFNLANGQKIKEVTSEYDQRGRITKSQTRLSNMPDSQLNTTIFETEFAYDQGGRVLTTTNRTTGTGAGTPGVSIPEETLTYTYNRPYAVGLSGYASNARFNKYGQMLSFDYGNGVNANFRYNDENMRLTLIAISGNTLAPEERINLSYQYDPIGNITRITDNARSATNPSQSFNYDALNRLLRASGAYGANYAYDDINNINQKQEGTPQIFYYAYSAGTAYYHRPSGIYNSPPDAGPSTPVYTFAYDQVGNMTSDGLVTYTYDADNRLSQATYNISTTPTPTSAVSPTATPFPTPAGVPGDANGDGMVDNADYTIWLAHYNQRTINGSRDGDFNSNGIVDGVDYTIWRNNYGRGVTGTPIPTVATTATPTPTSAPTNTPTPTPVPATPTPTPAGGVSIVLNSATGLTCRQVCSNQGKSCTTVGTDSQASNAGAEIYDLNQARCITLQGGMTCDARMVDRTQICNGNRTNWTRCRCE
ncbi:hypothetical protein A3H19_01945 [Candidatus Woesebacteria bacterium RIFCSPLOWO2_12_FULL_39_9]|nr:MAG: hypothetical protein A3H19_01945 [Candidatus Woesebacteria bacterium RIFCSPLOWO2_12_FULL_39_9]